MKELTRAEEQIMRVLWFLGRAFVKEIIGHLPDPKPAYNTVSTIVRILEKKGFVSHRAFGKTHQYYPIVEKDDYTRDFMNHFMQKYFHNSFQEMVSFFTQDKNLTLAELEEIKLLISAEIQKQRQLSKSKPKTG